MGGLGVGIAYSGVLDRFFASHANAVDFVAVIPELLWGERVPTSITSLPERVAALDVLADRYPLVAHGGTPSDRVEHWHGRYDFRWVGVPLAWGEDFDAQVERATRLQRALGCRVLFQDVASEREPPERDGRMGAVCRRSGCGVQLDLHQLHVRAALLGRAPEHLLADAELEHVGEIHIGGPVSAARWRTLDEVLPRCPNLRGVVFEAHDRDLARLGSDGIAAELATARTLWRRHRGGQLLR